MEERSCTFITPWRFSREMGQMRPNPRQATSCEQQNERAATPVCQLYSCSPIQLSCQCGTRYQAWRPAMYSVVLQLSSAESVTTSVCACVISDDKHWPKPPGEGVSARRSLKAVVLQFKAPLSGTSRLKAGQPSPMEPPSEEEVFIQKYLNLADAALKPGAKSPGQECRLMCRKKHERLGRNYQFRFTTLAGSHTQMHSITVI